MEGKGKGGYTKVSPTYVPGLSLYGGVVGEGRGPHKSRLIPLQGSGDLLPKNRLLGEDPGSTKTKKSPSNYKIIDNCTS